MSARIAAAIRSRHFQMQMGARGSRLRVVHLLAPFVVCACGERSVEPQSHGALARLEQFAFVPAGTSLLTSGAISSPNQVSISEPLLVGMYEVTRAEFLLYVESASPELDPLLAKSIERWSGGDGTLPVGFITHDEAQAYARWAGLRLLTSSEWLFCAISPRALAYPWADAWQQGRANTLDLGRVPYAPTPVGTFEGGRTDTHLYDMLGNVWEWAEDDLDAGADNAANASAFGGSYLRYKQELHGDGSSFSQSLTRGTRLEDLGFRVCSPARAWLEAHAGELAGPEDARARLMAVGRRWGSGALPLLGELTGTVKDSRARASLEAILSGARG